MNAAATSTFSIELILPPPQPQPTHGRDGTTMCCAIVRVLSVAERRSAPTGPAAEEDAVYGSDQTQDTENRRRGDGDGGGAGCVCSADRAGRNGKVLRERPGSHPLR